MSSVLRPILVLLRSLRSPSLFRIPVRNVVLLWLTLKRLLRRFGWLRLAKRGQFPDPPSPEPQPPMNHDESERIVICPSMEPVSSLGLHLNSNSPSRLLRPTDIPSRPHSSIYSNDSGKLPRYSYSVGNPSRSSYDITSMSISDYGHYGGRHRHTTHGGERRVARRRSRASARGIVGMVSAPNARTVSHSRSPSRPPSVASRASPLPSISRLPMTIGMPALQGLHSPVYPVSSPATPPSRSPEVASINIATPSTRSRALTSVGIETPPGLSSTSVHARDFALPSHFLPMMLEEKRPRMIPVTQIPRYDRNIVIPDTEDECIIKPMSLSFPLENVPDQWQACVHPEGALYFFRDDKKIFTDANLCDPDILATIEAFAHAVEEEERELGFPRREGAELVLDLDTDGDWCYYFADHKHRTLFWLHELDITYDMESIKGVKSPAHIKHEMENFYWFVPCSAKHRTHYEAFPHGREPPEEVINEVMGTLLHASIDQLTSQTSTATYTSAQLHDMLRLMREARALGHTPHTVCVVARMMQIFAHLRFINFHGQHGARLSRDQSVHGETEKTRTLLISLLSPMFFSAPDVHLRSLEKLWIDGLINRLQWGAFIERMQADWQEFILYATVMLNANVAFLTIPDVDPGGGKRTAAQIASFISIVASIGSIILGLLLVRQHRVKPRETASEAVVYLMKQKHPTLGLETLAILYSLPYALLMWAMVSFLLAFAFECFVKRDNYSTFTTLIAWIVVGMLISWCIYTAWDSEEGPSSTWLLLHKMWEHASIGPRMVANTLRWSTICTKLPSATVSELREDTV